MAGFQQFPGSGRLRVVAVPGFDLYLNNGAFISTENGIGWNVSQREDVQIGARLLPVFGRSRKSSAPLGLANIRTRLGKDAFLTYAPWQFLILQGDALSVSTPRGEGLQTELGVTGGAQVRDRALVGLTLGGTWSSRAYLQNYFGVTPGESGRGRLELYTPSGGWSDMSLRLSGEWQVSDRWRLSGDVVEARLVGPAARSPVVRSRTQSAFSLTLWYKFK